MVVLLRCSKQFLHPNLSPLSFFKAPPKFHSQHLNSIKNHGFSKRVHHICSTLPIDPPKSENGEAKNELWLYNTMSRQRELFKPKVEGKVGIYVCGITAYDFSHIGHARAYVTFDVLFRYLRYQGYEVFYVRNFTDVDDKIIARANELGEDPISLSRRFCNKFLQDMSYLHCLPPSVEPRVSDHIPQIVDMIKQENGCPLFRPQVNCNPSHIGKIWKENDPFPPKFVIKQTVKRDCEIVDNGFAYSVEGDVYFAVEKFPTYGRLSGRKLVDNRAGERVAVDSRKRNPVDFALWKSAKEGEPFWESPWGPGRPGWHIECSAMSAAYLGYSFDIHGGGMDLMFPHHENEIVQSCAACHDSNISYWVHNGFVTINSEKMSKSLGNFFTIRQVIELYHPLALRLFLMETHYRSPVNYSDVLLETASERIFYIYQTLQDSEDVLNQHDRASLKETVPQDIASCISEFQNTFLVSMSDDLHTPVVLAALSDPLKTINDFLHTRKGKKRELRIESLAALEKTIRNVLSTLGVMPSSYSEAIWQLKGLALTRAKMSEAEVMQKIEARDTARKCKDYEKSDVIRKELADVGIALMDSPQGTSWRPVLPTALQQEPVTASS